MRVKKSRKTSFTAQKLQAKIQPKEDVLPSFLSRFKDCKEQLCRSDVYKNVSSGLKAALVDTKATKLTSILCLGLGNFSEDSIAMQQLAIASLLREDFAKNIPMCAYDPQYTEGDIACGTAISVEVWTDNNERNVWGFHRALKGQLVFMPHCPHYLIEHFLFENWYVGAINYMILLSNSFSKILEDNRAVRKDDSMSHMRRIQPFVKETSLNCNFNGLERILCCMSFHTIPTRGISSLDIEFWNQRKDPMEDSSIKAHLEALSSVIGTTKYSGSA